LFEETASALGLSALALAGGKKVLGPTLDLLGEDLRTITATYRKHNLDRILEKAGRRVEAKSNERDAVHPRVAHEILDEGSWCDDELMQEYLAGLLIASRSERGINDDGAYLTAVVARLPALQVRMHNAFYGVLAGSRSESESGRRSLAHRSQTQNLTVTAPFSDVARAVDIQADAEGVHAISLALRGLHREGLCEYWGVQCASEVVMDESGSITNGDDILVHLTPTSLGADLFLWSRGVNYVGPDALRDPGTHLAPLTTEVEPLRRAVIGPARILPEFS